MRAVLKSRMATVRLCISPPKTSHPGKLTRHFKFSLSSYFRQEETRPASRSKSSSSPDANICEHQSMSDAWRGFFVKNHSNSNDQLLPHLRRKTASSSAIEWLLPNKKVFCNWSGNELFYSKRLFSLAGRKLQRIPTCWKLASLLYLSLSSMSLYALTQCVLLCDMSITSRGGMYVPRYPAVLAKCSLRGMCYCMVSMVCWCR